MLVDVTAFFNQSYCLGFGITIRIKNIDDGVSIHRD